MLRLRKKSDPSKSPPLLHGSSFPQPSEDEYFPGLPSADAFRTSLILPELARRFTLLRTSSGDPVSLVDLKLKFAEQRARGAPNQITEVEEDMILQTLGRIRSKHTASTTQLNQGDANASIASETGGESDYIPVRSSHLSNNTASTTYPASSVTSSPRSTKRYSNNLFSSGRLRDYGYLRTVSQRNHRSAASITHTESSQSLRDVTSLNSTESLRPTTPDGGPVSPPSSPNDKTPVARTASLVSSNEDLLPQSSIDNGSGLRISKRASAALAQVIKEFEEEAEDEIVMPRTAHSIPRPSDSDHSRAVNGTKEPAEPGASLTHHRSFSEYEAGTAISSDGEIILESGTRQLSPLSHGRPGTVSPTPRLPGYIPGMPRPMTPRESSIDTVDIRSHSTTPRASQPVPIANGQSAHITTSSVSSSLVRRGSDASRNTPRPTSPQTHATMSSYLSRSNSGRRTPDTQRDSASGTEQDGSAVSSVFVRRRPISPLSGPAFQPMTVSPRPSTPSNITWTIGPPSTTTSPEKARIKPESRPTHSRTDSQSTETDFQISTDRSKSPTKSPRSSVPPDSPGPTQTTYVSKWNNSVSPADSRAPSSLSTYDFTSTLPLSSRDLQSPTPTLTRNTASPTFPSADSSSNGTRSSKQHPKPTSNHCYGVSQLSLSPIAHSSRSSLESTGSSFHSWESRVGGTLDIFSSSIGQTPTWHGLDKSDSLTAGSSEEEGDVEGMVRRYAGLTKSDFVAIQERLVGAARHKATLPDTRERSNSLRRRRPSTSQSNYSTNGRVVSPTPTQVGPAGRRSPALDNNAKASALLESVVDSIPIARIETKVEDNTQPEISPTTRRNRDLARALGFGNDDSDHLVVPQVSDQDSSSTTVSPTVEAILPSEFPQDMESIGSLSAPEEQSETTSASGLPSQRSQSMRVPRSMPMPMDQVELAREVQRKADAATAALMKSPKRNFTDVNASTISVSRKKIDPSQISEPQLLVAPTTVETIPLPVVTSPPPVNSQPSFGITQRMRRFRNTLRVKPASPSGQEAKASPTDVHQGLHRRPTLPLPRFGSGSSTELSKLKTSSTSPPASVSPGFKGLMARFRKPRTVDNTGDSQSSVHSRTSPTTSSPTASSHQGYSRGNVVSPGPSTITNLQSGEASTRPSLDASAALANDVDSAAIKQLFEAASKIGLDQAALNDLLARSTSVSRAAGWGWAGGSSTTGKTPLTSSTQPSSIQDWNRLASPAERPPDDGDISNGIDDKTVRRSSLRKAGEAGQIRHNRQIPENAPIIRRTLIFPSEFRSSKADLSQVNRKSLMRQHRRSGSATSAQSARSVHDRVPTPPPPKGNGGRRFSTERSPPIPGVTTSIGAQAEMLFRVPSLNTAAEKPGSTYDSLYDMYSGESKHTNAAADDAGTEHDPDDTAAQEGPAIEVIEMANGETIWQVVNGLREDNIDSLYAGRTSMGSNYSTGENGDGVQMFVKEQARPVSRSGSSPVNSRKRSSQGKYHPETKVFYSTSAQIGRLIESLSQGMDAASFNFIFNQPPDHSAASSFHSDTSMQ